MVGDIEKNFLWEGDECWFGWGKKGLHVWPLGLVTYRVESMWIRFGVTVKMVGYIWVAETVLAASALKWLPEWTLLEVTTRCGGLK